MKELLCSSQFASIHFASEYRVMTFLRPTFSKPVIRALALGQLLKGQGIPPAKQFAHHCAIHTLMRKKMLNEEQQSRDGM